MEPLFIMPHIQVFFYLTLVPAVVALLFFIWWLVTYIPYKIADNEYKGFELPHIGPAFDYDDYHNGVSKRQRAELKAAEPAQAESIRLRGIRDEKEARVGETGAGSVVFAIIAAFFGILFLGISLIPFNSKYWYFYELKGEVTSISNVFQADDSELVSDAVVTVEGFDTPFIVDDPRILLYEGQELSFRCDWGWVPGGEDQLGCLIAEYPKN
jgi:hypothetical protein